MRLRLFSRFALGVLLASFLSPFVVHAQFGADSREAQRETQENRQEQRRLDAVTQNRCCLCRRAEEGFCTRLTGIISCDAFRGGDQYAQLSSVQTHLLDGFVCSDATSTACDAPIGGPLGELNGAATGRSGSVAAPAGGAASTPAAPATAPICPHVYPSLGEAVGSLSSSGAAERAAQPEEAPFVSITPQLGVSIPGLSFSPARKQGDLVYVPFLAQYIAAVERYAVGLAVIAAVIMVVYGGLRYLLGSAIQDVSEGKRIITDALVGMLIALGGYLILNTVNPNVLDLPEIKLGYINPAFWGENIGAYPSAESGTSACRCAPIPPEVNEARVLPVPCFQQCGSGWGSQAYGPNLLLPSDPVPANLSAAVGKPACTGAQHTSGPEACVGTMCQGACGPTSLAVVLGYYGASSREGSPVTPIEAARYLIRSGQRPFNGGTVGICSSIFSQEFPGYRCTDLSNVPSPAATQRIIQEIRAGHPVIFHCAECRIRTADGREIAGTGGGHYMVFTGVSEDGNILSVHDVGWGPPRGAIAMRVADLNAPHTFSSPDSQGRMVSHTGSVSSAYLVTPVNTSQAPPSASCQGRARRSSRGADGKIVVIPFTYCPGGACDSLYRANEASIIMDSSWLKQSNPAFRVFMYIHGLNRGGTGAAGANKWKTILANYPGERSVPLLIIRPHNYGGTNSTLFQRLNTQEVLEQALQALRSYRTESGTTIGSFTVRDVAISAHSSGICGGSFARAAATHYSYGGQSVATRGLVAFDAYGDCSLDAPSFVNPTGIAYIMNPDSRGMGNVSGRPFASTMAARHGMSGGSDDKRECPAFAREDGVTHCWTKAQSSSGNGYPASQNGWTLFETTLGHDASVDRVAGYALRAFYGN
jgi:hypothetical protein